MFGWPNTDKHCLLRSKDSRKIGIYSHRGVLVGGPLHKRIMVLLLSRTPQAENHKQAFMIPCCCGHFLALILAYSLKGKFYMELQRLRGKTLLIYFCFPEISHNLSCGNWPHECLFTIRNTGQTTVQTHTSF